VGEGTAIPRAEGGTLLILGRRGAVAIVLWRTLVGERSSEGSAATQGGGTLIRRSLSGRPPPHDCPGNSAIATMWAATVLRTSPHEAGLIGQHGHNGISPQRDSGRAPLRSDQDTRGWLRGRSRPPDVVRAAVGTGTNFGRGVLRRPESCRLGKRLPTVPATDGVHVTTTELGRDKQPGIPASACPSGSWRPRVNTYEPALKGVVVTQQLGDGCFVRWQKLFSRGSSVGSGPR